MQGQEAGAQVIPEVLLREIAADRSGFYGALLSIAAAVLAWVVVLLIARI